MFAARQQYGSAVIKYIAGFKRLYSTDLTQMMGPRRAIIYRTHGDPSKVLYSTTDYRPLRLGPNEVLIRFLLSPINPADLNVIEGTYPAKPSATQDFGKSSEDVFIAGNEAVAEVVQVGPKVSQPGQTEDQILEEEDWVVMKKPQSGTWINWKVVPVGDIIKIPKKKQGSKVTEVFGATLMVNAHTAYGLLTEVDAVPPNHYILQNGANSGVGQAIIQVARQLKIKTVNFVRDRPDYAELKDHLTKIGATHVFTYDQLLDKSFKHTFAKIREEPNKWLCRHAYNGIGGPSATAMAALLDSHGHLISYGGMSKEPIKIPVGLQIFKDLTAHGYWQSSRWPKLPADKKTDALKRLTQWKENGEFEDPLHEIVELKGTDKDVNDTFRAGLERLKNGKLGRKLLLKWAPQ